MKFSVFSVMTPDTKPTELVQYLAELGFDGVEWRCKAIPASQKKESISFWGNNLCTIDPGISTQEINQIKQKTEENGLEIVSVTPYLTVNDLKETENILQIANKFGARFIRLAVPKYDGTETYQELYQNGARYLKEAEELCKQYNIKGLVETHHQTIAPSASLAYRLVKDCDPDYVGILYDPGNMVHEGYENYRLGLELLGPYLAHVHFKNAGWVRRDTEQGLAEWEVQWMLINEGVVNWQQVMKDLKSVGYDGFIGVEDFSAVFNTKKILAHNLKWLKKLSYQINE